MGSVRLLSSGIAFELSLKGTVDHEQTEDDPKNTMNRSDIGTGDGKSFSLMDWNHRQGPGG